MLHRKSEQLFAEALNYIPGGVNSPVRAFRAVGGQPFFVDKAKGARVWDVDGNDYIDYVCTWGPAILGHAHPKIISAVKAAAEHGTSFGIPNPREVTMAKLIRERVPSVQKVRMTNSGTEACMSAIRLARGFTKRDKIIKFDGCYHGHADSLLVKAGSGALTFGNPDSAGVPAAFTQHTIVVPFNDPEAVEAAFEGNRRPSDGSIRDKPGPDRRHHRRAGSGQCRVVPAQAGLPRIPAEGDRGPGRAVDLRRSDDGLSPRLGRCAGALWHPAGPEVFWQDHRRGPSGGRLWRACGDHGLAGAVGAGGPGRDAERKPTGHGRRHRGAGGVGRNGHGWCGGWGSGSGRSPIRSACEIPAGRAGGSLCRGRESAGGGDIGKPDGDLCPSGSPRRAARDRNERRGEIGRCARAVQSLRLDVLRLFYRPARPQSCRGDAQRPGPLQELLPGDAFRRSVPGAVAVRGGFRLGGAHQ